MEGWPRIPNQGGSSASRPKASIPAPGTVVMASVEEDLGDGMYSLRWGGNRIAVSSRSALKPGQSLILKSEINAEGKPTLVVQGPALPEPGSITGKIIYGPGKKRAHADPQARNTASAEARDSRTGQTPGGQVAAGTAKAVVVQAPTPIQPVQNLIGLVLEPLPELEASVKVLEQAVEEEKERLAEKEALEQEGEGSDELQDEDARTQEKTVALDRRARHPAARHIVQEARPDRPAEAARPLPQPVTPEHGDLSAQARPVPPPQAGPVIPDVPAVLVPRPDAPRPVPPQPQVQPAATGPEVPEAPAVPAQDQQPRPDAPRPVSPQPPVQSAATDSTVREVPAVPIQDQQPRPDAPRPVSPQPPVQPAATGPDVPEAPVVPAQDQQPRTDAPRPLPLQPPVQPATTGPTVPEVPVVPVQSQRPTADLSHPPPQVSQIVTAERVSPEVATAPAQSQPPAAESPQPDSPPVVPQPVQPGTAGPVVPEAPPPVVVSRQDGGPVVPEAPPAPQQGNAAPLPTVATPSPAPEAGQPVAPLPTQADPGQHPAIPLPAQPPGRTQSSAPPTEQAPPPQLQPSGVGPTVPEASLQPMAPGTAAPATPPPADQGGVVQPTPPPPQPLPGAAPGAAVLPAEPAPAPVAPQPQPVPSDQPLPPAENTAEAPPPRQEPSPKSTSSRRTGVYGPPRSDTDAIRQRQATLPPAANGSAETGDSAARTEVKPEIFLKEALTQMVKAAELPLGGDDEKPALAVAGKPPQAVVDKAADLFLRAAGFEPDETTLAAARALVRHNVPVDRDSVQAMLEIAVDTSPAEREAAMNATARLMAKDIPVSPPLVAGLTDVLDRRAGAHALMRQAMEALSFEADLPEAQALMDDARQLLDMLHVDLGRADAAAALERYISTFGRETLGKALALVETAAQAVLEGNPDLQLLDRAISAVMTELTDDMAQVQQDQLALEGPPPKPGLSLEQLPPLPAQPLPAPAARPLPAINAYLNAPRAFNIAEALKNLPPMPTLININAPIPQDMPTAQPVVPPQQMPTPAPTPTPSPGQPGAQPEASPPAQQQPMPPALGPMPTPGGSSLLARLDSLFQIPGLNRPELELLRPSGFMERFLQTSDGVPDAERIKTEARALMRQLTSENAELAEKAASDLKSKSPEVLRQTAARLSEREAEVMRNNTVLTRLADAATGLRDLGRQLLAVKAENLAGQDREPGVMLAEVPFKLNDDAGDGRMQMFYRRSKKKEEGWTSRVILDLNTTRMGPVLGDMRFFGQDMVLNMFVERQDTAEYLDASRNELVSALADKGFRVKARFMVLPPRRAPEIRAERPTIAGEETLMAGPDGEHKVDIKG